MNSYLTTMLKSYHDSSTRTIYTSQELPAAYIQSRTIAFTDHLGVTNYIPYATSGSDICASPLSYRPGVSTLSTDCRLIDYKGSIATSSNAVGSTTNGVELNYTNGVLLAYRDQDAISLGSLSIFRSTDEGATWATSQTIASVYRVISYAANETGFCILTSPDSGAVSNYDVYFSTTGSSFSKVLTLTGATAYSLIGKRGLFFLATPKITAGAPTTYTSINGTTWNTNTSIPRSGTLLNWFTCTKDYIVMTPSNTSSTLSAYWYSSNGSVWASVATTVPIVGYPVNLDGRVFLYHGYATTSPLSTASILLDVEQNSWLHVSTPTCWSSLDLVGTPQTNFAFGKGYVHALNSSTATVGGIIHSYCMRSVDKGLNFTTVPTLLTSGNYTYFEGKFAGTKYNSSTGAFYMEAVL